MFQLKVMNNRAAQYKNKKIKIVIWLTAIVKLPGCDLKCPIMLF